MQIRSVRRAPLTLPCTSEGRVQSWIAKDAASLLYCCKMCCEFVLNFVLLEPRMTLRLRGIECHSAAGIARTT